MVKILKNRFVNIFDNWQQSVFWYKCTSIAIKTLINVSKSEGNVCFLSYCALSKVQENGRFLVENDIEEHNVRVEENGWERILVCTATMTHCR